MRKIEIEVPDSCFGCQLRHLGANGSRWYCPFMALKQEDNTYHPTDSEPARECRDAEVSQ